MKYAIIILTAALAGCASPEQQQSFEQAMLEQANCSGEVEQSYRMTFYSSDKPENVGKTELQKKCNPNPTHGDFEKKK
ncbi:hypothetical protein [Pseudoalteromonas ruthenica]|uniref:hypothetical protein n=1 Tax=Pseudoalteromonas ruthenica TaxID=151081 RepID=UPI001243EBA3|nr:hypothetical protein [Pseudoalteromonas ruthenica]